MGKLKFVHYINQFFANIGGEEKADYQPEVRDGAVGPGLAFNQAFGEEAEIIATVICGDSYFNENVDAATETVLNMIKEKSTGRCYLRSCIQRRTLRCCLRYSCSSR